MHEEQDIHVDHIDHDGNERENVMHDRGPYSHRPKLSAAELDPPPADYTSWKFVGVRLVANVGPVRVATGHDMTLIRPIGYSQLNFEVRQSHTLCPGAQTLAFTTCDAKGQRPALLSGCPFEDRCKAWRRTHNSLVHQSDDITIFA